MPDDLTPDPSAALAGAASDRSPRKATGAAKRTRKAPAKRSAPKAPRDVINEAKADIPKTTGRPPKSAELVQQVTQLLALVGLAVMMFNEFDGQVVVGNAAKVADSIATVAETSPAVRKGIDAAVSGSAWSAVVLSTLPIVIAILANHGVLPGGLREVGGVPVPEPSVPSATTPTPSPADGGGLASVAQMFAGAQAA